MTSSPVPTITLNNGVEIPQLGLGVFQMREGGEVEGAVTHALEIGYRHIDTAAIYRNEAGVGRAMKASGLPRHEIFLTTKLWNTHHAYDDALRAFDESMARLDCDYVDLYLIHWPTPSANLYTEAWRALEWLYDQERVRAIGVSNFKPHHLDTLLAGSETIPTVNQIELHPYFQQHETRATCARNEIAIESYSPLMQAGVALEDSTIAALAGAHGKSVAQVILRWHIQHGFIVIPKSSKPERIRENFELFDFELSADEMATMDALDRGHRINGDPDDM